MDAPAILPCVALGFRFSSVAVLAGPLTQQQREFWRGLYLPQGPTRTLWGVAPCLGAKGFRAW